MNSNTNTSNGSNGTFSSSSLPTSRYEELKIKDGPIYKRTIPKTIVTDCDTMSLSTGHPYPAYDESTYVSSPLPAETTALLIVDVQPEYWSNCPAVRKDFPHFPEKLCKTIEICRRRKAKIIWVRADYQHAQSPWLTQFQKLRGDRNLGEVPCDPTSPEFTWEEFATPEGGEVIIAKSSWSSTSNTALVDILKVACIENVLVCGLITSVCVQHSAFGIFEAGYRTLLVTDACADRGRARHEAALALYGDYMYELVTSDHLESKRTGLIHAEPVWLVLDEQTNIVRANSIPKQLGSKNDYNDSNYTIMSTVVTATNTSATVSMAASSSSASFVTNSISNEEEQTTKSDDIAMVYNNNEDDAIIKASETVDDLGRFLMIPDHK